MLPNGMFLPRGTARAGQSPLATILPAVVAICHCELVLASGAGRKLVDELYYWATNNLRVLPDSHLYKPMHAAKK